MITEKELCKYDFSKVNPKKIELLKLFLPKINVVRKLYNKSMSITSGIRTIEDHIKIYEKKGISKDKVPMGSAHLENNHKGFACDVFDPNKELQKWCLDNVKVLEEQGLYCEHFSATPNWVHFQDYPPASGNRFFKPQRRYNV